MELPMIRELWEYHHWANRKLFDVAVALGEAVAARDVGAQFSAPTVRGMFEHLVATDRLYCEAWSGRPRPAAVSVPRLAELRSPWDALEAEQRRFVAALADADLDRVVEWRRGDGTLGRRPLRLLLLHVPNHATHHRSEIATMITMLSGSPPDTGMNSFYAATREPAARA
jgi:uncharacterized damage-inducible protein DinB